MALFDTSLMGGNFETKDFMSAEWGVENISLRASVRRSGVAPLWSKVRHSPPGTLFLALLASCAR